MPLARAGLTDDAAARHVVAASWLSLAVVAGAAGVFALAGDAVARRVLGDAYGGDAGTDRPARRRLRAVDGGLGRRLGDVPAPLRPRPRALAAVGSRWARSLPASRSSWRAASRSGSRAWRSRSRSRPRSCWPGCSGLSASLAATVRGLVLAAATVGALALLAFAPAAALLAPEIAAASLVAYAALLVLVRPTGLAPAWAYLRALALASPADDERAR